MQNPKGFLIEEWEGREIQVPNGDWYIISHEDFSISSLCYLKSNPEFLHYCLHKNAGRMLFTAIISFHKDQYCVII